MVRADPTERAGIDKAQPTVIVSSLTAVDGPWIKFPNSANKTFHATVTGTGAVTAVIGIDASNDAINVAKNVGTITLTASTVDSDALVTVENWVYFRAAITTITGTGALAVVTVGS